MSFYSSCPIPIVAFSPLAGSENQLIQYLFIYTSAMAPLQHVCCTRPEIRFYANKLSQFLNNPRENIEVLLNA